MKKLLSFILVFAMILPSIGQISYADFTLPTQKEMEQLLLERGATQLIVNHLNENQLSTIYNNLSKNSDVRISMQEMSSFNSNNPVSTYGEINTNHFSIGIALVPFYSDNILNGIMVINAWEWIDAQPAGRREDVIHLSWNSSLFSFDSSTYAKVDTRTTHLGKQIEYNQANAPAEARAGEIAFYTNVYNGLADKEVGICVFSLIPNKTIRKGTNKATSVSGIYYHNKSLVPLVHELSIKLADGLINVSFNKLFTDTLATSTVFKYK